MPTNRVNSWWSKLDSTCLLILLMTTVTLVVFQVAPTEIAMGEIQRIVYIHVAVAWFSLFAFVVMAAAAFLYLRYRDLKWDRWSHAAAELGWLCCTLTLCSGSLWAHEAWGTWWTWDPRLTTSFVLWLIYTGILVTRQGRLDEHICARTCAVISLLGVVDIPLVAMATRWFRGIHPVTPEMEPAMRVVLAITVVCFTAFLCFLLAKRQMQLQSEHELMRRVSKLQAEVSVDHTALS